MGFGRLCTAFEKRVWIGLLACALTVGVASRATAQGLTSGSIRGTVTDNSSGALPGVSVTASGTALQAVRTAVTDTSGEYRFTDLPVGKYTLTFELAGFRQFVREGIELSANFTATVNVVMALGSLEETVTVSGQSPVVDVTSTTRAVRVQGEFIADVLPGDRTMSDVMAVTPGVQITARPDMGRGREASSGSGRVFGTTGQINPLVEGISTRQDANSPGNNPDLATAAEVQIVSVAGGASQATPGVATNVIVKSGGNDFHGRFEASGMSERFQGNNLTDELIAQGITVGDNLIMNRDLQADFGGRIIRDKLWFYGAIHDLDSEANNLGYSEAPGADGVYGTADDIPGTNWIYNDNQTAKVTYQASPNYRLTGFYTRYWSWVPERAGNRLNPRESLRSFSYDPVQWKGELQGTVGSRLVFNVLSGRYSYFADYNAQPDSGGSPSRTDLTTRLNLGPNINQDKRPRVNWQTTGSLTFFPEGRLLGQHELKVGGSLYTLSNGTGQPNGLHGNYFLTFDNGAAREMRTYNYPLYPENRMDEYGFYVEDSWRPASRLTLNLGLRMDYFNTFVPAQSKEQGQFGGAGSFDRVSVNDWVAPAPRLGVAFDVFGTGRTVIKGSFGRFNHTPGDSFAQNFNLNTVQTVNYRWRDVNGNNDYDTGEVNLNLNGPDFISISAASNNILNPDLQIPRTNQYQGTVEQELVHNAAVSFSYVYLRQSKLYELVNVRRPYEVWNVPLTRIDPGPDGVVGGGDDGDLMTIYDYDPAYRGAAFVQNQFHNRTSERDNTYTTIETILQKRTSNGWGGQASFSTTKFHEWRVGIVQSPNDRLFPVNESRDWSVKANANRDLPWGLGVSGSWILSKGVRGQRTFVFRNLPQSSTLTLPVETFGELDSPNRGLVNLRATKAWRFSGAKRIRVALDVLNLLNGAPPYAISYASGPTYGQWSEILSPRILKGGVLFEF